MAYDVVTSLRLHRLQGLLVCGAPARVPIVIGALYSCGVVFHESCVVGIDVTSFHGYMRDGISSHIYYNNQSLRPSFRCRVGGTALIGSRRGTPLSFCHFPYCFEPFIFACPSPSLKNYSPIAFVASSRVRVDAARAAIAR